MELIKSLFRVLFLLSLLISRVIFWTTLGSLPVIYFFVEVSSVVLEIVITAMIVSFCYYKMMIWFNNSDPKRI